MWCIDSSFQRYKCRFWSHTHNNQLTFLVLTSIGRYCLTRAKCLKSHWFSSYEMPYQPRTAEYLIDTVNFSQISVVASIFFWNRNCFASSRILFINLFVAHNRLAQGAIRSRGPTTGALHRLLFHRLLFHRPRPHLTTSDSPPPALPRPETALYDTLWIDFQVQSAPLHPLQWNQFFSQKKEHWGQLSTIISLQKEKSGCYSIG